MLEVVGREKEDRDFLLFDMIVCIVPGLFFRDTTDMEMENVNGNGNGDGDGDGNRERNGDGDTETVIKQDPQISGCCLTHGSFFLD